MRCKKELFVSSSRSLLYCLISTVYNSPQTATSNRNRAGWGNTRSSSREFSSLLAPLLPSLLSRSSSTTSNSHRIVLVCDSFGLMGRLVGFQPPHSASFHVRDPHFPATIFPTGASGCVEEFFALWMSINTLAWAGSDIANLSMVFQDPLNYFWR